MTAHSSILAWRIPWTEEPDGLQSVVLQRDRHESLPCLCDFQLLHEVCPGCLDIPSHGIIETLLRPLIQMSVSLPSV